MYHSDSRGKFVQVFSAAASFFCFEPVTHPINAHNLPGGPAANGLIVLDRDAQTSASFTMSATEV